MNKCNILRLFIVALPSVFSGVTSAATISFQNMPTAVFEHPEIILTDGTVIPASTGYDESGYHFAAIDVPNTTTEHIHGTNHAIGQRGFSYHADAGGWYSNRLDGQAFDLTEIDLINVSDITKFIPFQSPEIVDGDLIFEAVGGAHDGFMKHISPGTTGVFNFGAEFEGIDGYEVYFEGLKGFIPIGYDFSSVVDNVVVSAVPLQGALWMFGSGLLSLVVASRKGSATKPVVT